MHKHTSLSVVHDAGESQMDRLSLKDDGGRRSIDGSIKDGKDHISPNRHSLGIIDSNIPSRVRYSTPPSIVGTYH